MRLPPWIVAIKDFESACPGDSCLAGTWRAEEDDDQAGHDHLARGVRPVDEAHSRNRFRSAARITLGLVGRRLLTVRIAENGVARIDEIAKAEAVDRSEMVRRMLAYATRNMPKGWKP